MKAQEAELAARQLALRAPVFAEPQEPHVQGGPCRSS